MPKVLLQYSGFRFPLFLSMPWMKEPLSWDENTGRTIKVDSRDAQRLTATSGNDFHVVSEEEEQVKALIPVPLLNEIPPEAVKANKSTAIPLDENVEAELFPCPYCDRKPYKRHGSLVRHIEKVHGLSA